MVNAVRGERDFNLVATASGARRLRATAGCFLALVDLFVKGALQRIRVQLHFRTRERTPLPGRNGLAGTQREYESRNRQEALHKENHG